MTGPPDHTRATGRSAVLVGAGILASRVSGLVREMIFAAFFGTKIVADAVRFALQMPGMLQNILGEGVLSASFVPVYAQAVERDAELGTDDASAIAGTIASLLGLLTGVIVLVGIVATRPIAKVLLWQLPDESFDLTVALARIMWAGLGFIVLSAWCLGVLNTHRKFFLSYIAPVLWNAAQVVLASIAWLNDWSDASIARWAAWGVAIGGALQFLVQLPAVLKVAPGIGPRLTLHLPEVREVIRRFGPAISGRGVVQLSAFLDLVLAGMLAVGAQSGLAFAQILYLLPIGVFAMSVVAADLPELSREHNRPARIAARIRTSQQRVAFFVAFSAVAFIFAGKPLVGALFQRGEFTADDTVFVWLILGTYSLGLLASSTSRLLQNTCFALGDVRGPAQFAALRVAVAASLGGLLMVQADRFGVVSGSVQRLGDLPAFGLLPEAVREDDLAPQRLGAIGLAFGSAVAAWIELALLQGRVRRALRTTRPLGSPTHGLLIPSLAAAAAAAGLSYLLDGHQLQLSAFVVLGVSGSLYVLLAYWQGIRSAEELVRSVGLHRRRS